MLHPALTCVQVRSFPNVSRGFGNTRKGPATNAILIGFLDLTEKPNKKITYFSVSLLLSQMRVLPYSLEHLPATNAQTVPAHTTQC